MIKIYIDGKPLQAKEGTTIKKAAEKEGIHIPHLCYHPAFIPEGSCRMCLVEIEDFPNLELACSTQIRKGMKIFTMSERVIEARKGVLEFLLADHPLDCPICDKAGECKLQDYFEEYGLFEGRFYEQKEKREKKVKIGENLIHDQERCVLCRRCVRFLREITKTGELGVFERGVHSVINTFNSTPVENNYSGNLAEICPVGAITDSDFRFKTRSWFLKKGDSICPLCSRGCNITIEYHEGFARFDLPKRVYRIRSRENQNINGYWICDIGRYGYSLLDEERVNRILSFKRTSPSKNSFQFCMNKKIVTVTIAGFDSGIIILKNVPTSVLPSILAASVSSTGIVIKNPLSINVAMGRPKAIYEKTSENKVLYSLRFSIIIKRGIITAAGGIIIPNKII